MPSKYTWFVAVTAAASVLTLQPALADASETPESFVHRIYARYRTGGPGVSTDRPGGAAFYAAPLLDALAKDEALAHGEVGTIDGDPLCNCQDFGKLKLTHLAVTPAGAEAVEAVVDFVNLGSKQRVTLTLAKTPAGWRIADVGDTSMKSLMALLQDAAARGAETARPGASPASPQP